MTIIDRIKNNWIGGIIALSAICITGTWYTSFELFVKPRDFTIEQQKILIQDLREKIREHQDNHDSVISQNPLTSDTNIVLEPIWIYVNQPIQALSGQLLISVSSPSDFIHSATFDITLPDHPTLHFGVESVGTRREFTYKGKTYFFDILDASNIGAKIAISTKF